MDLEVFHSGTSWQARFGERVLPCAIGRGGVRRDKREGDGATPVGRWPLRRVLFRADRLAPPQTALACAPLQAGDGWCDEPGDPCYNEQVASPYPGRHERLWRDDEIYDCIVVLGYNDRPVRDGAGSAIFLHVARPDFTPTEGCVALRLDGLLAFLGEASISSRVCIARP